MIKNPVLLDLPTLIKTPRLLLRPTMPGDGKKINEAVMESLPELRAWMPWAQKNDSIEDSECYARKAYAQWALREDLAFLIFDSTGEKLIGSTGIHRIQWDVPRADTGYWIRTSCAGNGYITEAVNALTRYAFKELNLARLEIRCDENNIRSRKVAERLGFKHEATLAQEARNADGVGLRNTVIYTRHNCDNLPDLDVSW